jgi:ABC-2 type transport system permease protein
MLNLVLKDLLIQKKSFLVLFLLGLFMFIVYSNPIFENFIYIMGGVMIVYIFLVSANAEDEKNKSEIVLVSLPLSRRDIVLAKYVSVPVYVVIGLGFLFLMALVFRLPLIPLMPRLINLTDLLASLFIVGLAVNIYLPLYFRYGTAALRIFSVFLFLGFFFIPRYIAEYAISNPETPVIKFALDLLAAESKLIPVLYIVGFILLITIVSYLISKKIYFEKEF